MILHAIYQDLAATVSSCNQTKHGAASIDYNSMRGMERPMFKSTSRFASLTSYKPNRGASLLQLQSTKQMERSIATIGKTDPTRADRHLSWRVPSCSLSPLEFTLLEPNLRWLAFGALGEMRLRINSKTVPMPVNGAKHFPAAGRWVRSWVNVTDTHKSGVPRPSH